MSVTRFEVLRRSLFDGGRKYGTAGAYERIDALVRFAVDPTAPLNGGIADLEMAPRLSDGRVPFEADVILLRPVEASRGNGKLLASVVNRGRTALLPFSFPPPGYVPAPGDRIEAGDGFLLNRGWTVALCGWQWDVVRRPGSLGLGAPLAYEADGSPASTVVNVGFQPLTARASEYLGHWPAHPSYHEERVHHAYPAMDLDDPKAELVERDGPLSEGRTVDRAAWRFARVDEVGNSVRDARWIAKDGGFAAGTIYELRYRTAACPVTGTGLLAVRDAISFLRYGTGEEGNPAADSITHAYTHGVSQTGRFLREFLHLGLNVDEAARQVCDGVFVQIAGARRGEFNFRGAQPSAQYGEGPAQAPPYAYAPSSLTPETLLDKQRIRGGVPKVVELNTANEYWRSEAMLVHADLEKGTDLPIPEDVRIWMLAGCQHGPGIPFVSDRAPLNPEQRVANPLSMLNYTPATRAALMNLDAWCSGGVAAPESLVPTFAAGTAVARSTVLERLGAIPGFAVTNVEGPRAATPVADVDQDGNEVTGIRLPEVAAPFATFAGWNARHAETGGEGQMADMSGSTVVFPLDVRSRKATGDPRRSLEERYASVEDYRGSIREAATKLANQRFLLAEDVDRIVETAGRMYERVTATK